MKLKTILMIGMLITVMGCSKQSPTAPSNPPPVVVEEKFTDQELIDYTHQVFEVYYWNLYWDRTVILKFDENATGWAKDSAKVERFYNESCPLYYEVIVSGYYTGEYYTNNGEYISGWGNHYEVLIFITNGKLTTHRINEGITN